MTQLINYLCVLSGVVFLGLGFYFSAMRPPSAISLRSTQRCDNSGLYDTSMTYQDSCQTNRSVNRTYYRRQIQRLLLDDDSTNQMPRSQRSVRRNFSNSRRTRRQLPTTKLRSKTPSGSSTSQEN